MLDPIFPYPYAVLVCIVDISVNLFPIRCTSSIDIFPAVVLKEFPPKVEGSGITRPCHHVHPGVDIFQYISYVAQ